MAVKPALVEGASRECRGNTAINRFWSTHPRPKLPQTPTIQVLTQRAFGSNGEPVGRVRRYMLQS